MLFSLEVKTLNLSEAIDFVNISVNVFYLCSGVS